MPVHHFLAYIDPFSGTIILQAIIAGAVAFFAFFRRKVWSLLFFWKPELRDNENAEQPGQEVDQPGEEDTANPPS